jgi:hypothetical protein
MNQDHINALLKHAHRITETTVDGKFIVSDGHFFVEMPSPYSDQPSDKAAAAAAEKLAEYWRKYSAVPDGLIGRDRLYKAGNMIARRIGDEYVQEAYYLALCTPMVTKFFTGERYSPIACYEDGKLLGAIMPIRAERIATPVLLAEPPSDQEVFELFASEKNDYYLQGDKPLLKEIGDLEKELKDAEDAVSEAEDHVTAIEEQLVDARCALEARRAKVA